MIILHHTNFFISLFYSVINAGIPLVYTIGSICVILTTYVKCKRKKHPLYEPLIPGQTNTSYGAINSEESNIENGEEEEEDTVDKSEPTLSTNGHPRNKIFDLSRLFFGMMMFLLFCFVGFARWYRSDQNKHEIYWITSPIVEELVWVGNLV